MDFTFYGDAPEPSTGRLMWIVLWLWFSYLAREKQWPSVPLTCPIALIDSSIVFSLAASALTAVNACARDLYGIRLIHFAQAVNLLFRSLPRNLYTGSDLRRRQRLSDKRQRYKYRPSRTCEYVGWIMPIRRSWLRLNLCRSQMGLFEDENLSSSTVSAKLVRSRINLDVGYSKAFSGTVMENTSMAFTNVSVNF